MKFWIAYLVFLPWTLADKLYARRLRKRTTEVPPAPEAPALTAEQRKALAEAIHIEQTLRAEYLRAAYGIRRCQEARHQEAVRVEIDRLVREVEAGNA